MKIVLFLLVVSGVQISSADEHPCAVNVRDAAHAHCSIITDTKATKLNIKHIEEQPDGQFDGKIRYLPSQMLALGQRRDIAGTAGQYGTVGLQLHGDKTLRNGNVIGDIKGEGGTSGEVTGVKPARGRYSRYRMKRQQQATDDYAVHAERMNVQYSSVGLVPNFADPVTIHQASIKFSDGSSSFNGQGLWKLSMYGSKNNDGTGAQIGRSEQLLTSSHQAQSVTPGEDMTFQGVSGMIDMTRFACDREYRYLCFDFTKGDSPSVSFTFTSSQADSSKITFCHDRCTRIDNTAVLRGLLYNLEATGVTAGRKDPFTVNATAVFSEASDDIQGTNLWKLSMYASRNEDGSGDQLDRNDQLLTVAQQDMPLVRGQNLTFLRAGGEFDFTEIGCNTEWRYLCFEFTNGDNPLPLFHVIVLGDDAISPRPTVRACSDRCAPLEGGVLTKGLNVTFACTDVEAGVKDQCTINATVTFEPVSDDVEGFALWKLSMYGSKNSDGSGEQFQRFDQMLTNRQQAQPLIDDQDIAFYGARGEIDATQIGCDIDFRYLCFDFMKGDFANPDFNYTSFQRNTNKTTLCSNLCPPHEGYALIRGMTVNWTASGVRRGQPDPFSINATIRFSQASGSLIQGFGLWKLSMYGSANGDGTGNRFQQVEQILNASHQIQPMTDNTITFLNATGSLDITGIGCGLDYRYLCFDFKKGDNPFPDYNFTSLQDGDASRMTLCSDRCSQLQDRRLEDGFILVADLAGAILVSPIAASDDGLTFEQVPLQSLGAPVAVDFDPMHHKIYYTDVLSKTIQRANLDGSLQEVILQLEQQAVPDGMAVDKINRILYWTDAGLSRIERADLDGTQRSTILQLRNSEKPRAIVIDTTNGQMFWTDWGATPKIEKANIDGTSREVLVNTNLQWPNGLAIDFAVGRMYWCDAGTNRIESTDLSGNARMAHLATGSDLDIHPYDLGMLHASILWSDWRFNRLVMNDVQSPGTARLVGNSVFRRAGGMHIQTAFTEPAIGMQPQSRTRRDEPQADGPFDKCHDVIDPSDFFNKCLDSWCSSQSYDQYCDDIAAYAVACQIHGVQVGDWRITTGCDMK